MPPITSQPVQTPPPSYEDAVLYPAQPPVNPEVITMQPIPSAPADITHNEEIMSNVPLDPSIVANQLAEEEERRKKREECCCDPAPEPDITAEDCYYCYIVIRFLCSPCRMFCMALGECTNDCCEGCASCLHNCCEPNTDNTENVGCCGDQDGCCGDQDGCCDGDDCCGGGDCCCGGDGDGDCFGGGDGGCDGCDCDCSD